MGIFNYSSIIIEKTLLSFVDNQVAMFFIIFILCV